ncbi:MAG: sulfatase-like hydrolase/transferase [Oceanospirillaceae bacterium]
MLHPTNANLVSAPPPILLKDPFKQQLKICAFYLLFSLIVLSVTRSFILVFLVDWQDSNTADLISLLVTGLRFDLKISAVVLIIFALLPMLIMSLFNGWSWLHKVTRFNLASFFFISAFFCFLDIGFYFFFGTAISNLIFGIVDDGPYAVLISIFSDWRLDLLILCAIIVCFGSVKLFYSMTANDSAGKASFNKITVVLLTLVLISICALFGRGTFDTYPLSRRTTVINDNPIINSLALNGPYHFYYAYKDLKEDQFSNLSAAKILQQSKLSSLSALKNAAGFNDAHPLQQFSSVKELDFVKPNVIFVLMEGWSSHIAQQQSEENQVLGELAKHTVEDYFFQRIFSDKYGTNPTIESLLLNAPIGPIAQSAANQHSFSLSNVLPFKRQNYNTLFLSGGNSAWRKHGQFWPRQGFDQYIGRASIEKHFNQVADNPWGAYDSSLFEYLQLQLQEKAIDNPLFSFVLTTNNHAPIRLPKDYKAPPLAPDAYGFDVTDSKKHESLTGYNFQSNALGEFMTWLKQSTFADNTIVIATGDHVLKGFANYSAADQTYNRYAVATYLYVPSAYDQLQESDQLVAGSHKDLFPTLFELALNKEQYLAFGTPIMHKKPLTAFGVIDQGAVIFNNGISVDNQQLLPWKDKNSTVLNVHKLPLTKAQKELIKQQSYREILQKYLLVDDIKSTH